MPMGRIQVDSSPIAASHLLIGSSTKRLAVTIYSPATGVALISNDPQPAGGQGIALVPGEAPIKLWKAYHGEMVNREFYVSYSGTISPVAFIETID